MFRTIFKILIALSLIAILNSNVFAGTNGRLKIYCGITMMQAMGEIAKIVEAEYNCPRIKFVRGGSGDLKRQLLENQDGDLYLPGCESYIDKLKSEHPGFVLEHAHVGFNQAAIFVKKSNPKGIKPELNSLLNPDYKIIIGDTSQGSIGIETKKVLTKKGIYQQVLGRAITTLHSKTLTAAIKTGEADVTINWFAVSTWPENVKFLDAFLIDKKYATPEKLVLTVLKTATMQYLANKFLAYAASEKGKAIFKKYGRYNE